MTSTVGKSYEYNAICDVCGFKFKNYELKKRWDGYMVCDADWETRHIADFYRTKNDTHNLPFTRPDSAAELTWTPVIFNLNEVDNSGTITKTGSYRYSSDGTRLFFNIQVITTLDATTASSSATAVLPQVCISNGTVRVITTTGKYLGGLAIADGAGNATLPSWAVREGSFNISGSYGV